MSGYAGAFFLDMFDGSLMSTSVDARYVFFCMVMLGDAHGGGIVDMPLDRLAARIAIPKDRLEAAILELESPDPNSRGPELGGARVIPLEREPGFTPRGWRITNWLFYKELAQKHGRAATNREAAQRYRDKGKSSSIVISNNPPGQDQDQDQDQGIKRGRPKSPAFTKPTIEEVREHFKTKQLLIDPDRFWWSNEGKGWTVGKPPQPMKDWRAVAMTWHLMEIQRQGGKLPPTPRS